MRTHAFKSGCLLLLTAVLGCVSTAFVHAGFFYPGTASNNVPWPGGVIPYVFAPNLTAAQQQTYLDGAREWELAANVRFIPRTSESHYILFHYDPAGPNVVSNGSPQGVAVNSLSRGQVSHEVGHSLGFNHEHIRPGRDAFVTVLSGNITPGNLFQFDIDPAGVTNGAYDFESVMHFARDLFSIAPGVLDSLQAKPGFERFQPRMGNLALSRGDRAAASALYGPPVPALTSVVTNTADGGSGSLRAALYFAMDHPGTTITFDIPETDPGFGSGVFVIRPTGHLPPLVTDGTVIEGSTQPGFAGTPLIVVDGSAMIPEAYAPGTVTGLLLYSANNAVKHLSFRNFNWNGLTLRYADATNNVITGCWCGLDETGTNAAPNALQGILIYDGASRNIIGGTNAGTRNVLSGNAQYGVWVSGSNTVGNRILGSYIGTDWTGASAVSNAIGGIILTGQTTGNTVGGDSTNARNVISGNVNAGIWITGAGVGSNVVAGNFIGLNAAGTAALPNTFVGMYVLDGARFNRIGGTNAGERNVISGNISEGVRIAGVGASSNVVLGNFIGTDATGANAVGNGFAGATIFGQATANWIGGGADGSRNLISGNGSYGVAIGDFGTASNRVAGNFIGTDVTGTAVIGNSSGVVLGWGSTGNLIGGGADGEANLISGNSTGVYIGGNAGPGQYTSNNVVFGNWIGLASNGVSALPNYIGIQVGMLAHDTLIGGTVPGAHNVISGNSWVGIFINGFNTNTVIEGNFIGTDSAGAGAVANAVTGIHLATGLNNVRIGGAKPGAGNLISGNAGDGIQLSTPGARVFGNRIGVAADGASPLGNAGNGIFINSSSNVVGIGTNGLGAGNHIAFNGQHGVIVSDRFANVIRGNTIVSNGGRGISLGTVSTPIPNDPLDADLGPNRFQNFPLFTNAAMWGAAMNLRGTLHSTPNRPFLLDFYRSTTLDSSGHGEGEVYLGGIAVTTDGAGNATFSYGAPGAFPAQHFSATATDLMNGDTSELSAARPGGDTTDGPQLTPMPIPMSGEAGMVELSSTVEPGWQYRWQATTNLTHWTDLATNVANTNFIPLIDLDATNFLKRFYRVVSP